MQADNLNPEDVKKMEELFDKEIKPKNPDAFMQVLNDLDKQKLPKGCCFKDSCKANKPFWKKIFKKRSPK